MFYLHNGTLINHIASYWSRNAPTWRGQTKSQTVFGFNVWCGMLKVYKKPITDMDNLYNEIYLIVKKINKNTLLNVCKRELISRYTSCNHSLLIQRALKNKKN